VGQDKIFDPRVEDSPQPPPRLSKVGLLPADPKVIARIVEAK
jgi:hypothetical protein